MKKILAIQKISKYKIITIFTTVIIFSILYYLTVMNVYEKSIVVYAQMNGVLFTIIYIISNLILSVFFAIYLSLTIYKLDKIKTAHKKQNIIAVGAIALGTAVTGCPSCGIPLLALIGFPLVIMLLPLKGLEIKLLSIIILIISIYFIKKKL